MNGPTIGIRANLGGVPKMGNGMHVLGDGTKIYTRGGDKHRDNGPAEIGRNGYKAYFKEGAKHRTNGPAVVHPDGTQEYWRNGKLLKVIPGSKE